MKKILFLLFPAFCFTQKIKINKIESSINNKHYLLHCTLKNNSKDTINLIIPNYINNQDFNPLYNFFEIKVYPSESYQQYESPRRKYPILVNKNDVITVLPKSKINFTFDTSKISNGRIQSSNNIPLKKITLLYKPFIIDNINNFLSTDIQNLKIYNKEIISK